ncbi:MAG: beta-glucosidase [Alphaproteobacteria bacterium]|nr:beta-glucosidase [Alphaproteobacteria bacterium]
MPFLLLLTACRPSAGPADTSSAVDSGAAPAETYDPAYCLHADADDVEARIDALLPQLSLDEKARLMRGDGYTADGGIWRASGDEAVGIPGIHSVDGPRGVSQGVGPATAFPVASMRGATWDPALERRVGQAIGAETRAWGANTLLAPTINILMHPRWGRAQESYGEDPLLVGDMGVAFIEGAQEHVLATAKHFAANNIEDTRFSVDAVVDERTLREIYLPQFRRAAQDAHAAAFMSAYNRVNGAWASESVPLLDEILRQEWGYPGFVMSDWIFGTHDTLPAIEAGLDLEMPAEKIYGAPLADAVRDGLVDEARLDLAIRRLLRAQLCHAMDVDPPVVDATVPESAAHLALAREVAERGMVLLKNDGAVLPVDRDAAPDVVVIGRLADVENIGDLGSSAVAPTEVMTAWEGLSGAAGAATLSLVPGALADAADRDRVAAADVVIAVVGFDRDDEGEGTISAGDREGLALSEADRALLADAGGLTDALVVVLEGSGPVTMDPWLADAQAVLMAFYPGARGGEALAGVVYGDVNPSGRLPMVFPAAESDLPPFDNVSDEVVYAVAHGYRHLDREGLAPLFAMGFGLSYTTWSLQDAAVDRSTAGPGDVLTLTVDVGNTGARDGRLTVQVYAEAPDTPDRRYLSELRAHGQLDVAAGGTGTLTLTLPVDALAHYDVDAGAWVVQDGDWTLRVGQYHGDPDALAVPVRIAGD